MTLMYPSTTSPPFIVRRREPVLLAPDKPTPHEFKPLSDLDDQDGLKFHIPVINLYPSNPSMQGVDPVKVIREAIARTLVFYYPFAGRLRQGPNRKLIVECTGEGILFIEADADVTLQESGNAFQPPFPYLEDLLFDVPGSSGVLNCPLLLIQVTRLKCGGFVLALRCNHTMSDGFGIVQFLSDMGEIARGREAPSILPVWERHVLSARNPPRTTCVHLEYEKERVINDPSIPFPLDDVVHRAFFFGPKEFLIIRKFIPPHIHRCSKFEILTACMWKCRTVALQPNPTQNMRIMCNVNVRKRFDPPLLPEGYYGNGFLFSTAISTAEELIRNPVGYAIGLIRKTKEIVTRERIQSAVDTLVIRGRPLFQVEGSYMMSDNSRIGYKEVDFVWGNATYGVPFKGIPIIASFCVTHENDKGENGIVVPLCLPAQAMERFEKELKNLLQDKPRGGFRSSFNLSAL